MGKNKSFSKFLFYLFKCFGLAPMKYHSKNRFIRSNFSHLINASLLILVIATNSYAVRLSITDQKSSLLDRTIAGGRTAVGAIANLIILIFFSFRQNKAIHIVNNLKYLHDISTNNNKRDMMIKSIKKICMLNVIAWLPKVLPIATNGQVDIFDIIMYYIAAYICDITIMLVILQYSLILNFVKRSFEGINKELNDTMSIQRIDCLVVTNKKMKITNISQLRALHMLLCEACEDIEEFYSKPILFCTFYVFVTLILFAYYVARPLMFSNEWLPMNIIFHCLFHMAQGIVALYSLTNYTSAVVKEGKRTGKVVNKLIGMLMDDEIINKLNQFSEYILHQNIEFSAAGLFLLDGTLIMSVIGSITTYMVILLQFHEQNSTQA